VNAVDRLRKCRPFQNHTQRAKFPFAAPRVAEGHHQGTGLARGGVMLVAPSSLVLELATRHQIVPDRDEALRRRGFVIERCDEPTAALQALQGCRHSVAVLHRAPLDGIALGRTLRILRPELGIVLLGREWACTDRRRLIEEFADECLVESADGDELVAVLIALERRASAARVSCHLRWRSLSVDLVGCFAVIDGAEVPLQPLQMRILACLIRHAGSVVTSAQLQSKVFRVSRIAKTSIPRQISVLRRQLGSVGAEIETVPGGYALGLSAARATRVDETQDGAVPANSRATMQRVSCPRVLLRGSERRSSPLAAQGDETH
jgi:DNA-binding response OmpR family regulator